jgi:asparagine synthase (glutamine-hydrolysing)
MAAHRALGDRAFDLSAPPLSRWELATGLALGTDRSKGDHGLPAPMLDPRAALAAECFESLASGSCVVSFSGGRDSSAVLAAVTQVARREGLPDPVPVTLRFSGIGSADESKWQELVIAHLGLREWERIEVEDELDLLGPVAREALLTHGLLWPPNAYVHVPILDRARGGCVLTGLDGDGLLGDWRWTRAQAVLHRRVRPQPRDLLRVGLAVAPSRARQRWIRPAALNAVPWLRPEARAELAALVRSDAAREPRRWDHRIAYYRQRRYLRLTVASLELLATSRAVTVRHPLLAPAFLGALARSGGAAGYGDRTGAMRVLFGGLLPEDLIARRGKAEFGRALWKRNARAFATSWDGNGVDLELVDPERVREAWNLPSPWFGANTLLHQAWLAAQPR